MNRASAPVVEEACVTDCSVIGFFALPRTNEEEEEVWEGKWRLSTAAVHRHAADAMSLLTLLSLPGPETLFPRRPPLIEELALLLLYYDSS